ncbi:MAG: AAA family ATPase [Syntrophobacteraceae bacterium]|nr:AAA family ATPase [Syntrophobacteraceae bacterium]
MYLEFYKFNKEPFHITPDPQFLFLSPSHKKALDSIFTTVERRKGIIAVTGAVGVGKTTILRSYIAQIDKKSVTLVYLHNSEISFDKLLKHLICELGISGRDDLPLKAVLFRYLMSEYKQGRLVALIIDEAQNMPSETLGLLRNLADLEDSQDKLLQIVLVGQPEFEQKLNLPELKEFNKRIARRCRIEALRPGEGVSYIEHRLTTASSSQNPVFTNKALHRIVKAARGVPRVINVLCDNVLIAGYGYQRNPVDNKIAEEVIRDFQGVRTLFSSLYRYGALPLSLLLMAILASAGLVSSSKIPAGDGLATATRSSGQTIKEPVPVSRTFHSPPPVEVVVQAAPKTTPIKERKIRIRVMVNLELWRKLKGLAHERDEAANEILEAAMKDYLKKAKP